MRYRQCVCMLFLATPWTQNLGVRNFNKTSSKYKVNMLQPWLSKLFDQNFLWMYIYKKNQWCSKKHAQPRKLIILNNQDICCCVGVWNLTDESLLQNAFGQANCFPQFRTILKIILMQIFVPTEWPLGSSLCPVLFPSLSHECYSLGHLQ